MYTFYSTRDIILYKLKKKGFHYFSGCFIVLNNHPSYLLKQFWHILIALVIFGFHKSTITSEMSQSNKHQRHATVLDPHIPRHADNMKGIHRRLWSKGLLAAFSGGRVWVASRFILDLFKIRSWQTKLTLRSACLILRIFNMDPELSAPVNPPFRIQNHISIHVTQQSCVLW